MRDAEHAGVSDVALPVEQTHEWRTTSPTCGGPEWWTWWRSPVDGLWRPSLGRCADCR